MTALTPPPRFDLPPGRLAHRRDHLVAEIAAEKDEGRVSRALARFLRRGGRTVALGIALFLLTGAAVAATQVPWYELLRPSEEAFFEELRTTVDGKTWILGRNVNARGDLCLEIVTPYGWRSASCRPMESRPDPIVVAGYGGTGPEFILDGYVSKKVERLMMVRVDCSVEELPISKSGLFFSVVAGADASPLRLEGFDGSGRPVATYMMGQGLVMGRAPAGDC